MRAFTVPVWCPVCDNPDVTLKVCDTGHGEVRCGCGAVCTFDVQLELSGWAWEPLADHVKVRAVETMDYRTEAAMAATPGVKHYGAVLGLTEDQVRLWSGRGYVSDYMADKLAVGLGDVPDLIWSGYREAFGVPRRERRKMRQRYAAKKAKLSA